MQRPLHPLHIVLLAGTIPLFLGVLLADFAYFKTFEVQWKNFSSWLIVGGLVFCGLALLWALIDLVRIGWRVRTQSTYFLLLLAIWVLGFINALVHAGDAWASMPTALVLSAIVAVLVLAATGLGLFNSRVRGTV
ncbi:MAG: putative rane protein [Steroidobacteraceae bacterium]|jgi:uncharacterized membrane protein|nr:putative rane protein [Steroidobacteraceae bacterium]